MKIPACNGDKPSPSSGLLRDKASVHVRGLKSLGVNSTHSIRQSSHPCNNGQVTSRREGSNRTKHDSRRVEDDPPRQRPRRTAAIIGQMLRMESS